MDNEKYIKQNPFVYMPRKYVSHSAIDVYLHDIFYSQLYFQ